MQQQHKKPWSTPVLTRITATPESLSPMGERAAAGGTRTVAFLKRPALVNDPASPALSVQSARKASG